jgi:hypothetical protein
MPGLVLGIHAFLASRTWMAGTSSAKTRFALLPGHDAKELLRAMTSYTRIGIRT